MNTGKIVQISGPVIDVQFESGVLPKIREALSLTVDGLWVTAIAMYPTARILIIRMLRSTSASVSVKIPIRYLPKIRISRLEISTSRDLIGSLSS